MPKGKAWKIKLKTGFFKKDDYFLTVKITDKSLHLLPAAKGLKELSFSAEELLCFNFIQRERGGGDLIIITSRGSYVALIPGKADIKGLLALLTAVFPHKYNDF